MSDAAQSSVSAMTKKPSLIEWVVLGVVVFGASLAANVSLDPPWDRAGLVVGFPVAWFMAQLVARRPLAVPKAFALMGAQLSFMVVLFFASLGLGTQLDLPFSALMALAFVLAAPLLWTLARYRRQTPTS